MPHYLKRFIKFYVRHPAEALIAYLFYWLSRLLGLQLSSWLFGACASLVGPLSKAHKTGHKNLQRAFPEMDYHKRQKILKGVWNNFGRVMGEYPHLHNINIYQDARFEIQGLEYLDALLQDDKPGIIFGAHLASWEVAIMAACQRGLKVSQLYRATNNPYVDKLVRSVQRQIGQEVLTKGPGDAKKVLAALLRGDHLFILMDQKMHQGPRIPFFGYEAKTAGASARLALKLQCPLLPVQVQRLNGFTFLITFHPPMDLAPKWSQAEEYTLLCEMNHLIEQWVRQKPAQWLWIHQRWSPDSNACATER